MIVTQKGVEISDCSTMPNHKSASAHAPRRSSADTDSRSATPSQVQVSVQVGTRWDNYASLRDPGTDSQSMHKVPSSASCPDLEPGTIYNAICIRECSSDGASVTFETQSFISVRDYAVGRHNDPVVMPSGGIMT
ncbi:uncharacterized protein LOC122264321 [Penaeus japonicus]|uniref:uncharacterized protein LOC122264321 n=1 Tax=Penaeus japonicus TaxID=27405 RepID=UPI001C7161EF|nr:uncharacterized protein LOC122264321 [Penaeus japonicus]